MTQPFFGTCSWKYEGWRGIIYPELGDFDFLQEYSRTFNTVEVDQWFWSLFGSETVKLPDPETVEKYASSVPEDFKFTIKVPNSITLTHFYNKDKSAPLTPNPHFLSEDLMIEFLQRLEPLNLGPIMFQFEYLNKKKMKSQKEFLDLLKTFFEQLPSRYTYGIELRNPNYLKESYFRFLQEHDLAHVFIHGYYMPAVYELYNEFKDYLGNTAVIRLMGPDRKEIEKLTKKHWNEIVLPKDDELKRIAGMIRDLMSREKEIWINVNNHYEGSAPKTIEKLKVMI